MTTRTRRLPALVALLLLLPLLVVTSGPASARDSTFTQKGSGPLYWSTYGYNFPYNAIMPESVWQDNVDWVAANFKNSGYAMVATDGWIGGGAVNGDGYVTHYGNWTHDWSYWAGYASDRGLSYGIYWNPAWISQRAVDQNNVVKGTNGIRVQDVKGPQQFGASSNDGPGYWQVDISKPGAEQWIKGNIAYYKSFGTTYLRVDFLRDIENKQGSTAYATALRWMHEAAGNDMFLSLVMPNCYDDCANELRYGDMIRVSEDTFQDRSNQTGWSALSSRNRGYHRGYWPQFDNAWDGLAYFSKISGKGKMILDGDFLIMGSFADDTERRTAISLYTVAGSPVTIADFCPSGSSCGVSGAPSDTFRNSELVALNRDGLVGKPLKGDDQRWVGQLSDGSLVVGLFNREDSTQTRSIDYARDLGLSGSFATRDLWARSDLGARSSLSVSLGAHDHRLLKITGSGIPKPWSPPSGTPAGTQLLADDFEDGNADGWTTSGGTWSVCQVGGNSKEYCKTDTGTGLSTAGSADWRDYDVQAYVTQSTTGGSAALLARVQDANRFYQLELKNDGGTRRWAIWKNNAGSWSEIARGDYAWNAGSYYLLRFKARGSTLTAEVSTNFGSSWSTLGSGSDSTFGSGRVGVRSSGSSARFDQVKAVSG